MVRASENILVDTDPRLETRLIPYVGMLQPQPHSKAGVLWDPVSRLGTTPFCPQLAPKPGAFDPRAVWSNCSHSGRVPYPDVSELRLRTAVYCDGLNCARYCNRTRGVQKSRTLRAGKPGRLPYLTVNLLVTVVVRLPSVAVTFTAWLPGSSGGSCALRRLVAAE